MAGTWKPKCKCFCENCGWTGVRAIVSRSCPKCGFWHPKLVKDFKSKKSTK